MPDTNQQESVLTKINAKGAIESAVFVDMSITGGGIKETKEITKVSKEVAEQYGLGQSAGRYVVKILPIYKDKEGKIPACGPKNEYIMFKAACSARRKLFHEFTVPTGVDGRGMIRKAIADSFAKKDAAIVAAAWEAYRNLIAVWHDEPAANSMEPAGIIWRAKDALGPFFNLKDYPCLPDTENEPESQGRPRFNFDMPALQFSPITDGSMFATLQSETLRAASIQITENNKRMVAEATNRVATDLLKDFAVISERLRKPRGQMGELAEHIKDLKDMALNIPTRLNLAGDEQLNQAAAAIAKVLDGIKLENGLAKDMDQRKQVADTVDAITKQFAPIAGRKFCFDND